MTVQAQDSVQYYDGPINVGAVIPITDFTFIDNSHVSLKIRGIDEIWEYDTDYTVDGADTLTRTITLNRAVEAGQVLTAYLDVPITQNISPEEGGNFPASTNEFVLDKLTYICQMLYERLIRALQVSVDTPFNGTLPDPNGKANKIIALNSTGTGLAYSTYDVSELEYIANRLYASIDNVDITANNIEDIITATANILSINIVADAAQSVITTAESITNVNVVGDDLALGVDSAINKVNANKENIDINAANIEDIQNAEENAQTCIDKALEAATSANRANTNANNATIWAEGTDEQVETLGGQHSAKGWAEVASQGQIQSDWEQEDATKKDYIKNKPNLDTGYFPGVHVGLADNLYDASAPVDISSFWFRTSAGEESITTGPAALRALRGNMLNSGYTPRSGNYTASSGITVNNFDLDAFEANNPSTGTYVFQYNRPNWTLNGSTITPGSWGLDVTPRSESLSITTTGEITAACTDVSVFTAAVGGETGSYIFTFVDYDDDAEVGTHVGPYWTYNGEEIDLIDYALSITGEPVNNDSIIVNYTAPLLTGVVTVEYVKAVLGTLIPAAVDYLFATVSMNQYDKNGIGRLTHIINNATIDSTGKIISGTGKVACVRAVGGIYSGYVAYSENQYITRIAHTPLVWNNGAAILPAIGDTLSLDDTTQDVELSVALFDPVSWVCVAVTDDSDLSIHPRWSSGQDQDHTYDEYSDNHVEIPKVDKNGVDLPTGLYGMPAIGNVFDEIKFENVNTYIKRIERVANTVANMAMVQAYGTLYLYDSNYIFYVLKDTDIVVYELGDVSDDYIANDYGTEALVATTPDNMCTLNISYGTNLKDKLRTNVLTISQQDLTAAQQEQVRTNIGISNSANLFDFKWTDHLLNSPNHLRADTFSWHDGTAYSIAYNELLSEYNAATEAEYDYNITTVGNLTKDNGVLSGFSGSNYATLSSLSLGNNFEIMLKITTGSDVTSSNNLWTRTQNTQNTGLNIAILNGVMRVWISSNGSSYDIASDVRSTLTLNANTSYYIRVTHDSSAYLFDVSTDKINWVNYITINSSSSPSVYTPLLGSFINESNTYWRGSIDLKESYVNINGQRWWTGAEVRYKVSPKGYKIAPAAQEQSILNAYNDTGLAWYYILDTENIRFKLPRTKWGFKGLRDSVGAPIASGLPDHTHTRGTMNITAWWSTHAWNDAPSGAVYNSGGGRKMGTGDDGNSNPVGKGFDASRSWTGSTSTPNYSYTTQRLSQVQEPGTQMYLYFYIGENTQSALYNTAGLNAELFNSKLDSNASNLSSQGMRYIAGMGMPSNKRISLTLGASGSTYTAPANGWFCVRKGTASTNQYIAIGSGQSQICSKCFSPASSNEVYASIPVLKNQTVWITYTASGSTNLFCFIYAQGSESEAS